MGWQKLVEAGRIREHATSRQEIDGLRAVVVRDLADAGLADLSADRRFATAYNAVLQLAKMVIACAGYRIGGPGHHRYSLAVLPLALGEAVEDLARYFDVCRRKRNTIDYDLACTASETEADELITKAKEFNAYVERWIAENRPDLA
jgi:hypothetical protein